MKSSWNSHEIPIKQTRSGNPPEPHPPSIHLFAVPSGNAEPQVPMGIFEWVDETHQPCMWQKNYTTAQYVVHIDTMLY